ncbi:TetR/AcrR family transcriptional regulator [uncultured Shimia sp.]|uniref:TetR/AcrR family transcriptional regulator n=1 Tax=uncultured Shimia sp. TaxID=573152 RepID=UPI0025E716C8|nr:TetR/AcrR family transcriptional regulator [uncultured Shimia sp.]
MPVKTSAQPSANPRKKPRQARAQATVDAILQAAAHILVGQGFEGFNTNVVAERAGASVGSLYQYFPNKEAIISEMVRAKRARLLNGLQAAEAAHQESELPEALAALVAATIAHQKGWPQLSQALDRAAALVPLSVEGTALTAAILELLQRVLRRHDVADVEIAALDLLSLCRGMIDGALLRGETDTAALQARVMRAASGYLGIAVT